MKTSHSETNKFMQIEDFFLLCSFLRFAVQRTSREENLCENAQVDVRIKSTLKKMLFVKSFTERQSWNVIAITVNGLSFYVL